MIKHKQWIDDVYRVRGDRASRHDKVRLDKNERLDHFSSDVWRRIMEKIRQEHVLAYPEVETLYGKLAAFLKVPEESLVVTAGSDHAIKIAFELCVNPGDRVVVLEPTFAMVDVYCGLYQAERVSIGYDANLNLSWERLIEAIDEKVSLLVIANPNSPTGTYIQNEMLAQVLDRAHQYDIPVLVDEAYYGFCPYTALDLLPNHSNLIITRTFSKTAGLAGLRIGYMIAQPSIAKLLYKFRPMYEVNSIGVLFASELLDNWSEVENYIRSNEEGKHYLLHELKKLSFPTIDTLANFIHVNFGEHKDNIHRKFEREGVLVRGSLAVPGLESFSRISVGPVVVMDRALECIRKGKRP